MINTFFKSLAVVFIAGFIGQCAGDRWDAPANQKDPGAPLVAGIPIDGKAYPAPFVSEDGNIQFDCFHISFQNVDGYEVINLRFDGILNPLLDENSDDDQFNDEYMRFYGTESPCQNIYLTIDGKPKGFSVYNFRDGYGPFFAKGCNCAYNFIPFFGKGVLDGSCQVCKNSFVLSFVNVPELRDGKPHTVKITALTKNFKIWGEQIYEDVIFEAGDVCPDSGEEEIDDPVEPTYDEEEIEERLDQVLPPDIRERVEQLMPLYLCGPAPDIEGEFVMSPFTMTWDDLDQGVGETFIDRYIKFYNQDKENNLISYSGYTNILEEGDAAFISGCDNSFTVFFNVFSNYDDEKWIKKAVIISGTMTEEGIKDMYYAFIVTDKYDPYDDLIPVGTLRILQDGDTLAELAPWPSFARGMAKDPSFIPPLLRAKK